MHIHRLIICCLSLLVPLPALAAVPLLMPTQGLLTDNAGVPVTGDYGVTFALYESATDDDAVWTESWPTEGDCAEEPPPDDCVSARNGHFLVELGTHVPMESGMFSGAPVLWLGVSVEGEPELPRRRLGTTPYAMHAASADVAHALQCTGCIDLAALAPSVAEGLGGLEADGLNEVSNGTLTNEFARTYAPDAGALPVTLGLSADVLIAVEHAGELRDLTVSFSMTHPFVADLAIRLLPPGDIDGIVLIDAGQEAGTSLERTFTVSDLLPQGDSLAQLIGSAQHGTWILRFADAVQNGNEGQGVLESVILQTEYLSATEVGLAMPDGSVQLLGPDRAPEVDAMQVEVDALQAEIALLRASLWCVENCAAGDCVDRVCDGVNETCVLGGALPDETACAAGAGVCKGGACCIRSTCFTLGALSCGSASDGCGGTLECGGCDAGQVCDGGFCSAPRSCKAILDGGLSTGDGSYLIDVDTTGPIAPFQVWCDMTTDSGGWTLIGKTAGLAHDNDGGVLDGHDTARWQNRSYLGSVDNLDAASALGPAYEGVSFTDFMLVGLNDNAKKMAWRMNNPLESLWAVFTSGVTHKTTTLLVGNHTTLDWRPGCGAGNGPDGTGPEYYGFNVAGDSGTDPGGLFNDFNEGWCAALAGWGRNNSAEHWSGGGLGASCQGRGHQMGRHYWGYGDGCDNGGWSGQSNLNSFYGHAFFVR